MCGAACARPARRRKPEISAVTLPDSGHAGDRKCTKLNERGRTINEAPWTGRGERHDFAARHAPFCDRGAVARTVGASGGTGVGAELSEQTHHADRAVRGRRAVRHLRAAGRRPHGPHARPADHHRKRRRCRRYAGRRARGQGRARRLHAADPSQRADRGTGALYQPALRFHARLSSRSASSIPDPWCC